MNKRPIKMMHWLDALALLESGEPCDLKVWKLSTGDIIEYRRAVCIGWSFRRGTHRILTSASNLPREFRDITLFEINGYEIIR
ncbi:maintenance system killer protein [Barnesiella sp. WM24]|uniref:maintenance system killer protein n=1 Tax=Barnesiella sp. WM24 TaxID=2558278 RepID=UPI0010717E3B|nr:maintenance system killer protein [Barnesiella sp. WM24]TFU93971.1 maintenance system killer protein [Barnesiella sp. WM24]